MFNKPVGWFLCGECLEISETDGFVCPHCRSETKQIELEEWMLDQDDETIIKHFRLLEVL
jgi:RNA polymerase subunit RPABC4/transcription elongation factor Spt4